MTNIGFTISSSAMIWVLIQKQIASAAGDQKKRDQMTKNLVSIIITIIILGITSPLCEALASVLLNKSN